MASHPDSLLIQTLQPSFFKMPYGWQKPVDLAAHLLVRFFFPPSPQQKKDREADQEEGMRVYLCLCRYFLLWTLTKYNYHGDDCSYSGLNQFY